MRTFFFDLDGTLADGKEGLSEGFRHAIEALGLQPRSDAELLRYMGTPLPEFFRSIDPKISQTDIDRGIHAFRHAYARVGLPGTKLYSGVREMLEAVQLRGERSWIVTSKPEPFASRIVRYLEIEKLVRRVVAAGSDETDTKRDLMARAVAESGAARADIIALGDRHYDIVGARENSLRAVGALWGYGSRDELTEAGCREFASNPKDFLSRFVLTDNPSGAAARAARLRTF